MSDVDPAEVGTGGRTTPESFDEDAAESAEPPSKKAEREGLPANYRMRADAHYVDAILSRRGDRAERSEGLKTVQRRSEAAEIRAELDEARELRDRHARLLAQLTEDLGTIESVIGVLAGETSRVARKANLDVVRAQTWRASWILKANAIVDGTHRTHMRPRPLGYVLGQVRNGFAAEARLTGVALQVHASDWEAVVAIDEQAVIAAITGALLATCGLVGQSEGATIKLAAMTASGELRSVEIVQDEVGLSAQGGSRFFDVSWADRPGGWSSGLGAHVARLVAQQHGGDAAILVGEPSGTSFRLSFCRPPAESTLKN